MKQAPRPKKRRLAWFGVKTVFRTAAVGSPRGKDAAYDPTATLVEERVVLFRARHGHAAIRQAEAEARRYARDKHVNPYGQQVVTRYLGACDAFELFEPPGSGREVFSSTEVIPKHVKDRKIIDQRLGHRETKQQHRSRKNILDELFAGSVGRDV